MKEIISAGSSFGAGFIGTQSAMTAISTSYTSSFLSGAAIGGVSGFSSGFATGFGNGVIQGQPIGEAIWSGTNTGIIAGASGAIIGGITGGIDAYMNRRNVWSGDNVEIGRTRLSLNNSSVSPDRLYYVDKNGNLYRVSDFYDELTRRINPNFFDDDGTFDRFFHELDLETFTRPKESISLTIPQGYKIKGFAGIETGEYYWSVCDGVQFSSNNGLNKVVTSGPGSFSFPSKGLETINARIFGNGMNNGHIYGGTDFKVVIRLKSIHKL